MDAPVARPYEAWALEGGHATLIHRGETIGECTRTLGVHRVGLVAKDGKVLSEKGYDKTVLKALARAAAEDWKRRQSEPQAPALPEGVDPGPPKVSRKRAPEPVPPPPLVPEPIEAEAPTVPVEATPTGKATCTKCHEHPVAGTHARTRPEERTWCARCRKVTCEARLKALRSQSVERTTRKATARAVRTTEPSSPLTASLDRWEALGKELEEVRELVRLGRAVREATRG